MKSSLSSSSSRVSCKISSSESSTTTFLRVAARRDGLVGDTVDIAVAYNEYFRLLRSRWNVCLLLISPTRVGDRLRRFGKLSSHYLTSIVEYITSQLIVSSLFARIMDGFDEFEMVFGSNPNVAYDEETRRKILHHRQSLEGELFIDRLLKALGIRKGILHCTMRPSWTLV